jgi:mono/diheme cytochrome c family protein
MQRRAPMSPAMLAVWSVFFLLLALATDAGAQDNDQQRLGARLFNQSCRVCHTKPQLNSPLYGPALSMNSLGGKTELMREVIGNATPRMPGFRYYFKPAEIDAIIAYLKTIPVPAATASPAGKGNTTGAAD